jgi:hypothetical protein
MTAPRLASIRRAARAEARKHFFTGGDDDMGEAKRRGASPPQERLPDFVFGRDKAVEQASGFVLAGKLITNIPQGLRAERGG